MKSYINFILQQKQTSTLLVIIASTFMSLMLIAVDITHQLSTGIQLEFIMLELGICLSSLVGVSFAAVKFYEEKRINNQLNTELSQAKTDAEVWRKKTRSLSQQFIKAIEDQLKEWGLSHTENDIALLLIKGMSSKDIATLRNVTEKTIRAHSSAIYRKSGLKNRYELAAYFVDNFLE
ncbi:MAG: hypothetical protein JNM93_04045 [Bacteriovoracaceae bacterium]|nr:hypothetical protein [Bacteriovoracaceae bacterium]